MDGQPARTMNTREKKSQTEEFRISYGTSRSISIRLSQSVEWREYSVQGQDHLEACGQRSRLAVVPVRTVNHDMYTLYVCEIHHNGFSFHEVRIKLPVPIAAILAILRSPGLSWALALPATSEVEADDNLVFLFEFEEGDSGICGSTRARTA
jgi:hypothetical protein